MLSPQTPVATQGGALKAWQVERFYRIVVPNPSVVNETARVRSVDAQKVPRTIELKLELVSEGSDKGVNPGASKYAPTDDELERARGALNASGDLPPINGKDGKIRQKQAGERAKAIEKAARSAALKIWGEKADNQLDYSVLEGDPDQMVYVGQWLNKRTLRDVLDMFGDKTRKEDILLVTRARGLFARVKSAKLNGPAFPEPVEEEDDDGNKVMVMPEDKAKPKYDVVRIRAGKEKSLFASGVVAMIS